MSGVRSRLAEVRTDAMGFLAAQLIPKGVSEQLWEFDYRACSRAVPVPVLQISYGVLLQIDSLSGLMSTNT